jgi:rhodanese-related sulfurtransferase
VRSRSTFLILLLLCLACTACDPSDDFRNLSAQELKRMIDEGVSMLVVDARSEYEYTRGHIPTAILLTQNRVAVIEKVLPGDKNLPVIFYCRSYG